MTKTSKFLSVFDEGKDVNLFKTIENYINKFKLKEIDKEYLNVVNLLINKEKISSRVIKEIENFCNKRHFGFELSFNQSSTLYDFREKSISEFKEYSKDIGLDIVKLDESDYVCVSELCFICISGYAFEYKSFRKEYKIRLFISSKLKNYDYTKRFKGFSFFYVFISLFVFPFLIFDNPFYGVLLLPFGFGGLNLISEMDKVYSKSKK